jgi:signal transduction histidine kinase/HAMP domain-containing protein
MLTYTRRLITYFNSRIRFKIILPYALLTLMVAIIGVYLSTRLVADSLVERFTRQLIEAGSTVADGLAQREQLHLSHYNAIAFTEGIDEAILTDDRAEVESLVFPLTVNNNNIDRVDIVNMEGLQLLEIHRPPGTSTVGDYTRSHGADLSDWPTVQKVLSGVVDKQGDKYVTVAKIDGQDLFVTIGPVKQGDEVVGAVLVSSYVHDLLGALAQATFADVNLYDLKGHLLNTTFGQGEKTERALALDDLEVRKLLTEANESSLRREILLEGRRYDLLFGVFRARGEPLGFYSVALQRTFIDKYGTDARNYMVLIFATALVLVFGIGYLMANAITGQLQHLMENALAVASGDFTRRIHISSDDEIGSLAISLDHMTESLASYTSALQKRIQELTALYEGSTAVTVKLGLNLEQVLQAVTTSVKDVIRGTDQVVVHLLDESGRLLVPRASTLNDPEDFPSLAFEEQGEMRGLLAAAKPLAVRLSDLGAHSLNGTFKKDGTSPALIAPLIAGKEMIGMLTLTPDETDAQTDLLDEDNDRLLGTMANQAAIAIKNAQLFEATERAYQELRKLDDLKTQFINIAAHELRTPLGAMMGYASYAEKRAPEKLRKSMRFLVASTVRMRTMVDAMLTIQRLDAGTAFLRLTTVDIRDVIDKVVADFEPMAELEGHSLTVNMPDELPLIHADPEKIGLILSNLLSNAIKFTPEGGHLEVAAQSYLKGILVSVRDNGGGIAPEDQERIFERFYQARVEHIAGHGGMGLGLTIVKHLVELHEGQIWLESEIGKGTTFFFTLPQETPLASTAAELVTADLTLRDKEKALLLEAP